MFQKSKFVKSDNNNSRYDEIENMFSLIDDLFFHVPPLKGVNIFLKKIFHGFL